MRKIIANARASAVGDDPRSLIRRKEIGDFLVRLAALMVTVALASAAHTVMQNGSVRGNTKDGTCVKTSAANTR